LLQYKANIVQNMNQEFRIMMQQALEEAEIEMRQKMEMISQIKDMEARVNSGANQKLVDLTETGGYGLLSEMSIAELRERLRLQQMAEDARLEAIREDILADKQEREKDSLKALQNISRHRAEICRAAAVRFEERKQTASKYCPERPITCATEEMKRQLEEKRAVRRLQDEQSRILPPCKMMIPKKNVHERQGRTVIEDQIHSSNTLSMSLRVGTDKTKSRVVLLSL